MVTIVDPHLKRDENYYIHKEATSKGLYVKNKDGTDFDGWCWPGQSSYLDFTNPKVMMILIPNTVLLIYRSRMILFDLLQITLVMFSYAPLSFYLYN
jgi:hypothetical protein